MGTDLCTVLLLLTCKFWDNFIFYSQQNIKICSFVRGQNILNSYMYYGLNYAKILYTCNFTFFPEKLMMINICHKWENSPNTHKNFSCYSKKSPCECWEGEKRQWTHKHLPGTTIPWGKLTSTMRCKPEPQRRPLTVATTGNAETELYSTIYNPL